MDNWLSWRTVSRLSTEKHGSNLGLGFPKLELVEKWPTWSSKKVSEGLEQTDVHLWTAVNELVYLTFKENEWEIQFQITILSLATVTFIVCEE